MSAEYRVAVGGGEGNTLQKRRCLGVFLSRKSLSKPVLRMGAAMHSEGRKYKEESSLSLTNNMRRLFLFNRELHKEGKNCEHVWTEQVIPRNKYVHTYPYMRAVTLSGEKTKTLKWGGVRIGGRDGGRNVVIVL